MEKRENALDGFEPYKIPKRGRPRKRQVARRNEWKKDELLRMSGALEVLRHCEGATITKAMAMMFGGMAATLGDIARSEDDGGANPDA